VTKRIAERTRRYCDRTVCWCLGLTLNPLSPPFEAQGKKTAAKV
jgi:hypothetical protein